MAMMPTTAAMRTAGARRGIRQPVWPGLLGPEVRAKYTETYRDPARVHAICEEYRAAATLDIEHDKKNRAESRRITCPMLHLWARSKPGGWS